MSTRRLLVATVTAALAGSVVVAVPAGAAAPNPRSDPARVSLSTLRPSTSRAPLDRPPVYGRACHANAVQTAPAHCSFGAPGGRRVIVAIGDSHMVNYFGALHAAARSAGWRLVWMTKSACPGQDASIGNGGTYYRSCDVWRAAALRKIRAMSRVDAVMVAGSAGSTLLARSTRRPVVGAAAESAEWRRATLRTIAALRGQAHRVIVLRDTPNMVVDVPRCLVARGGWTGNCSRPRSVAVDALRWQAERSAAAVDHFARATELTDSLCATSCRPVTSTRVLRWRDRHHLTNSFSALMASTMRAKIAYHLAN